MTLTTKPKNYPKITKKECGHNCWKQIILVLRREAIKPKSIRASFTPQHLYLRMHAHVTLCILQLPFFSRSFKIAKTNYKFVKNGKSSFPVTIPYRIRLKRSNAMAQTFELNAWMNKVPNKSLTKYLYWRKDIKGYHLQRLRLNG